jgi:citrate synthase
MAAISAGLEGVVAATTALSEVDGERGELIIGGFPVAELADNATFEETTWLLWHGELPSRPALETFRAELAAERPLPDSTIALLRECARQPVDTMDALRIGAGAISLRSDDPRVVVAQLPTIVATFWRLRQGKRADRSARRSWACGKLPLHVER